MPNMAVISRQMVTSALSDPNFYKDVPEFSNMRVKMEAMKMPPKAISGCAGCRGRRVVQNLAGDFLRLIANVDKDAQSRLKKYFKVDGLVVTMQDPKTGAYTNKVI